MKSLTPNSYQLLIDSKLPQWRVCPGIHCALETAEVYAVFTNSSMSLLAISAPKS
jgi:hypothetical protein